MSVRLLSVLVLFRYVDFSLEIKSYRFISVDDFENVDENIFTKCKTTLE